MAKLNRPNGPPIDLEELRAASPQDAFLLFTQPTQDTIELMSEQARDEIGKTLVGLADVVARNTPPAIRLDILVSDQWGGEVVVNGMKVWGKRSKDLPRLVAAMVEQVAEQASEDAADKRTVFDNWAAAMSVCCGLLEARRDLEPEPKAEANGDSADSQDGAG